MPLADIVERNYLQVLRGIQITYLWAVWIILHSENIP